MCARSRESCVHDDLITIHEATWKHRFLILSVDNCVKSVLGVQMYTSFSSSIRFKKLSVYDVHVVLLIVQVT